MKSDVDTFKMTVLWVIWSSVYYFSFFTIFRGTFFLHLQGDHIFRCMLIFHNPHGRLWYYQCRRENLKSYGLRAVPFFASPIAAALSHSGHQPGRLVPTAAQGHAERNTVRFCSTAISLELPQHITELLKSGNYFLHINCIPAALSFNYYTEVTERGPTDGGKAALEVCCFCLIFYYTQPHCGLC